MHNKHQWTGDGGCKLNTRQFNAYLFSSPLWWRLSVTIAALSRWNRASTLKAVVVSSFNRTAVHHRALLLWLLLLLLLRLIYVGVFPHVAVMAAPLLQPRQPSCLKGKEEVRSQTGGQRWGFTLGTFSDIYIWSGLLAPVLLTNGRRSSWVRVFLGGKMDALVSPACLVLPLFITLIRRVQTEVHINNGVLVDVKCSAE